MTELETTHPFNAIFARLRAEANEEHDREMARLFGPPHRCQEAIDAGLAYAATFAETFGVDELKGLYWAVSNIGHPFDDGEAEAWMDIHRRFVEAQSKHPEGEPRIFFKIAINQFCECSGVCRD